MLKLCPLMVAILDGGLGHWIILKVDHLRTIHAMFALNWLTGFRGQIVLNIFPIGSYVKTMSADGGHLGWRSGSQDIILKVGTIHMALNRLNFQRT